MVQMRRIGMGSASAATPPFPSSKVAAAAAAVASSSIVRCLSPDSMHKQRYRPTTTTTTYSYYTYCRGKCWRCIRMTSISAVIPFLFMLRFVVEWSPMEEDSQQSRLRFKRKSSTSTTAPHQQPWSMEKNATVRLAAYRTFLEEYVDHDELYNSDVVELHHCINKDKNSGTTTLINKINWTDFLTIADPLLRMATTALQRPLAEAMATHNSSSPSSTPIPSLSSSSSATTTTTVLTQLKLDMEEEFLLELLEQYLSVQGLCDYSQYRPTVTFHDRQGQQLQSLSSTTPTTNNDKDYYRLAMIISAYTDFDQLQVLIQSIYQKQHYIVIHVDRHCSTEYRAQIQQFINSYANIVLVQFGTVVYRTDSLSLINLRILRWLTIDLRLPYEQVLLLDGSAFPLQSASQLVSTLQYESTKHGRSVWLGELTHQGKSISARCTHHLPSREEFVTQEPADQLLRHKRLIFTRNIPYKLHKRLPLEAWSTSKSSDATTDQRPGADVSTTIRNHMIYKSTSGNQGIYSRLVVEHLLKSDAVMELFALSKYGCCCCLEERNWIAALSMVGYACEAMEHTSSMFQVWGGTTPNACTGSMKNAVLTQNATLCYRTEDPIEQQQTNRSTTSVDSTTTTKQPHYFYGNDMWNKLVTAKHRGYLFARKFQSNNIESVQLRRSIQNQLWTTTTTQSIGPIKGNQ